MKKSMKPQRQKPRLGSGNEMAVFYSRKTRIDDRPRDQRNRAAMKREWKNETV